MSPDRLAVSCALPLLSVQVGLYSRTPINTIPCSGFGENMISRLSDRVSSPPLAAGASSRNLVIESDKV